MPARRTALISSEYYHVYCRSIGGHKVFTATEHFSRAIEIINYYSRAKCPIRYSYFHRLSPKRQSDLLADLKHFRVEIVSFCLMQTHYHFVIRQTIDNGIRNFIHDFQDSYGKYFNLKNERHGALFQSTFKAVHINSEEQFLHTCRYIHLNPFSSGMVKDKNSLLQYPWSSLPHHSNRINYDFISNDALLHIFPNIKSFLSFTLNHAEYQKSLEFLKHHTPGV